MHRDPARQAVFLQNQVNDPARPFARRNLVLATVTPGDGTSSLVLVCHPEGGAWLDWFMVDDGTNLENAEAITRALSRRISEHRKQEQQASQQTATEKELTVAKLTLLHAKQSYGDTSTEAEAVSAGWEAVQVPL